MDKLSDILLSTSKRWWTGKEAYDYTLSMGGNSTSTSNTHTSPSPLPSSKSDRVHQTIEELKKNLVITKSKSVGSSKGAEESVMNGLRFIFQLLLIEENFDRFGADALQTFQDAATTAEEPIRNFALMLTEITAQMWLHTYALYTPKEVEPSVDEILDFTMGIYSLERIGIAHDSKEEIKSLARTFSVADLFGVEYKVFRPPQLNSSSRSSSSSFSSSSSHHLPMEFRDYTNALTYSFYAVKAGIDLHVDLITVIKLLPSFRPYRNFSNISKETNFDDFADQLTMVFNLVHVLSNYGEFQLSPSLLPLEFQLLNSELNIKRAIDFSDVHLLGEIMHCLRVFGVAEANPNIQVQKGFKTKRSFYRVRFSFFISFFSFNFIIFFYSS